MTLNIIKRIGIGLVLYVFSVAVLIFISESIAKDSAPASMGFLHINRIDDFVFANGTWVIEGNDGTANPIQTTKIQCDRVKIECITATASISTSSTNFLDVNLERQQIVNWSASSLTYIDNYLCVHYRYTIDWVNKSATGIRKLKPEMIDNPECSFFTNELRLTLKDGFDVYKSVEEKARPKIISSILDLLLFWVAFL